MRRRTWLLALCACLGACTASGGATERGRATARASLSDVGASAFDDEARSTRHACRAELQAAQSALPRRRHALVQLFVSDLAEHGIGSASRWMSFRRVAAGLTALREEREHAARHPGAPPLYSPSPPPDLPQHVERWSASIRASARPGTVAGPGAGEGDYDFLMKEMVSLLYSFRDEPSLLTDEAAWNIVDRGLAPHAASSAREHFTFDIDVPVLGSVLTYPETENHVLMTLSSIYLARQWIRDNPRGDARLTQGRYATVHELSKPEHYADPLLQCAGRVLHNGFFETNARPYQAMSTHALLALDAFAGDEALRTAARNALDYLATTFAFQSLEMKRFGPYRRSAGYADRVGLYENDGLLFMLGALAGGHSWPESFLTVSNAAGHALWASLLTYRVPEAAHDLMLHKHSGYWARMHTRFSDLHYEMGRGGRYFDRDGQSFARGTPKSLPELYFATQRFMNAAGGRFARQALLGDQLIGVHGVQDLDFLARPHALITRGHVAHWRNVDAMARDVLTMRGDDAFWRSDNSGTYKSFSYGYRRRPGRDVHMRFPMQVPASWQPHVYREGSRQSFKNGAESRADFRFIDLSRVEPYGFYVVLARVSKSENSPRYREVSRGFWEIVPKERFASARDLKEHVLASNPATHFRNETRGATRFYRYRMTTGELLELDDRLGHVSESCENPIRRVWPEGADPEHDAPYPLASVLFDRCDAQSVAQAPLIDVREVDGWHRFTGRRLAFAAGDGRLQLHNPYLGASLQLDSSDYRNPHRHAGDVLASR